MNAIKRSAVLKIGIFAALLMLWTVPVLAQEALIPAACRLGAISKNPGGCTICHLGVLLMNITDFFIKYIAIPAGGLLIAIGGATLLVSSGSESLVKQGKQTITYAIVGIVIVLFAWLAVDTVIKVLVGSKQAGERSFYGTFGPWNKLPAGECGI